MRELELGNFVVRDKITGLAGVAVCKTTWLNGCVRFGVQPIGLHEGKPVEMQYFDDTQLEFVEASHVLPPAKVEGFSAGHTGGDRPAPGRAPDPKGR